MLEVTDKHRVLRNRHGLGLPGGRPLEAVPDGLHDKRHRPLRGGRGPLQDAQAPQCGDRHGDGLKGWPEQAPFDRIILTAVVPDPAEILAQLKPAEFSHPRLWARRRGLKGFRQHLVKIMQTESGPSRRRLSPWSSSRWFRACPRKRESPMEKRANLRIQSRHSCRAGSACASRSRGVRDSRTGDYDGLPNTGPRPTYFTVVVRQGDTLASIGARYDVPSSSICA